MPNRLAKEKSPYLLMHAENPVDWYPWGIDAFERAEREDKPIFLSIGYSSCHWCHVMERESFVDEEVAALLNSAFVCVKVDREERPDIDAVYMTASYAMTGKGGWPLTMLLTPDKKPFFAATYMPKQGGMGGFGLMELVPELEKAWKNERQNAIDASDAVMAALSKIEDYSVGKGGSVGESILSEAFHELKKSYDFRHGGFGGSPKFPSCHNIFFLLRYWKRSGNIHALEMAEGTLKGIGLGGIRDHIGGGFHRYSTDGQWKLPHFEKMLYDQALISMASVEAYLATGDAFYEDMARDAFDYVVKDMTSSEGGFWCAEDADSEGVEGKFYLWDEEELQGALGKNDAGFIARIFNVEKNGNFLDEATGEKTGKNILYMTGTIEENAVKLGMTAEGFRARFYQAREKLLAKRNLRSRPMKDDKILCDMNGVMIAALSTGARAFSEPKYAIAAKAAARFALEKMKTASGGLLHEYREIPVPAEGFLTDYAFLAWGLLELYEATFEEEFLFEAMRLNEEVMSRFSDKRGGFYLTSDTAERVLVRQKDFYDGAFPSGNAVAVHNLLRLWLITGDKNLLKTAEDAVHFASARIKEMPSAHLHLLSAVDFMIGPSFHIAIAGSRLDSGTEALINAVSKSFIPNRVVLFMPSSGGEERLLGMSPSMKGVSRLDNKAAVYVCKGGACLPPVTTAAELLRILDAVK
ncbi:MAG: thioredoxin domain-containing protein [Thermodesulfobacteriota bacterium]